MSKDPATISRDQFKRLCDDLLKDAPSILGARNKADSAMDSRSALLQAMYVRLQEKLGIAPVTKALTTRGFQTYEFSFAEAVYELALERATKPFNYQAIVEGFLNKAQDS